MNVALLAACVISVGAAAAAPNPAGPPAEPIIVDTTFSAVFVPEIPAVTYEPAVVPESGKVRIEVRQEGEATLAVAGLEPNQFFGAHLHVNACGPAGSDAGGHYQHTVNADPAFANPENEVWLHFATDESGIGSSGSVHAWPFDPLRPPRSLVIQDGRSTAPLACVNVPW